VSAVARVRGRLRRHDWFGAGVDLFVVVVGIVLALQLNGWAQDRQDRRAERGYLLRLKEDMQIERARMDAALGHANRRIEAARLLERLLAEPALAAEEPARVAWAVETASWRSFPHITAFVYNELQSTGRLALIRSDALRRSLAEHYVALQHDARVGMDLSVQHWYDEHVAGVLTTAELEALEAAAGRWQELSVDVARARAITEAFARRDRAVAQLPALVQHHTFNLRVIADMQRRADEIVRQIDVLLAR
jgi:hypothetical protein